MLGYSCLYAGVSLWGGGYYKKEQWCTPQNVQTNSVLFSVVYKIASVWYIEITLNEDVTELAT